MVNRKKEINSLDRSYFKKILNEVSVTPEFARLFNWGAGNIKERDREILKCTLIDCGLESPITDDELNEICTAICSRAVTYK